MDIRPTKSRPSTRGSSPISASPPPSPPEGKNIKKEPAAPASPPRPSKAGAPSPHRAFSWTAPEVPEYERGPLWYILTGVSFAVLIFLGIIRRSFIEIVLFSLFGIFLLYLAQRRPEQVHCTIDEAGLEINKRLIPWEKLESFNIIYIPGQAKRVLFRANKFFFPLITVELGNTDPVAVREELLRHLPEDPELQEGFADALARRFKL